MKKKNNLLCVLLSFLLCMVMLPASAVNAATVITENKTGTEDGYDYELWKDSGTTSMTLTGGGTFSCEWSNINNALFRKGIENLGALFVACCDIQKSPKIRHFRTIH